MRYHVAPYSIWTAVLLIALVGCSIVRGQALDFKVDGPATAPQGELVELVVMFPKGFKADVDFTPVDEDNFSVDPIIEEDAAGVITLVGKKCSFSTRCAGARTITVVASGFAIVGDGVPRLKNVKHTVQVTAVAGPEQPPAPPKQPPNDDDLGPIVPLPSAALPKSDSDKIALILNNVIDRLEALEKRSTQVAVKAPAAVEGTAQPATSGPDLSQASPSPVKSVPSVADVRPGHWSVASARNEWAPTKEETIAHLRSTHSSAELQKYEPLEAISHDSLRTLHDNAHEGRATSQTYVSAPASAPVVMRAGACPGGVCPTSSSSRVYSRGLFGWRR